MLYGNRIEALEKRIEDLEKASTVGGHMKETNMGSIWYGHEVVKYVPVNATVRALLKHLGLKLCAVEAFSDVKLVPLETTKAKVSEEAQ
jgi:hypothetical protein